MNRRSFLKNTFLVMLGVTSFPSLLSLWKPRVEEFDFQFDKEATPYTFVASSGVVSYIYAPYVPVVRMKMYTYNVTPKKRRLIKGGVV